MNTPPAGDTAPFALDHQLIRRRFSAAALAGATPDPLTRTVAARMDERLDYIRIDPRRVLDLGCGTGADLNALTRRYPDAQLLQLDFALPALARAPRPESGLRKLFMRRSRSARICACAEALPLTSGSVSMVWSNLMLNWLSDPFPALLEAHRVLHADGLLMFSTLGPDTLRELRFAFDDPHGTHVHRFIDMHDLGDALVRAGFSDPVVDMDMITITYPDVDTLFDDLRSRGGTNAARNRARGLSGRARWAHARTRLESLRRSDGLPISAEVIQGHAWKAAPRQTADGRNIIRFTPRKEVE